MRNLAGHKHSTLYAAHELGAAGVPARPCDPYGEPDAAVEGILGRFTFLRSWRYWVVDGPMPLEIAQALFDGSEEVRRNVRAAGDCTGPRPGERGALPTYRDVNGLEVIADPDGEIRAKLKRWGYSASDYRFVDSDEDLAVIARPYIEVYHVDSQEGLRLLADAIRGLPDTIGA